MTDIRERPTFCDGQYLEPDDLTAVVDYARVQLARMQMAGHTWGIALGLDLVETDTGNGDGSVSVVVEPGFAWDGYGRPILVTAPKQLQQDNFQSLGSGSTDPISVPIFIVYDEEPGGRAKADPCNPCPALRETYRIEIGQAGFLESRNIQIKVGGQPMSPSHALSFFNPGAHPISDKTVPFQDLPVHAHCPWPLFLGKVLYQPGTPGSFLRTSETVLEIIRPIRPASGLIARDIYATDGVLNIHPRAAKAANPLLRVAGSISAAKEVLLGEQQLSAAGSKAASQIVSGTVSASGQPQPSAADADYTVANPGSSSTYTITFNNSFDSPPAVTATSHTAGIEASTKDQTAEHVTVVLGDGVSSQSDFSFIAIGKRR